MIEIKNVSTSYTKGKKIIDNMNLKIEDGTIFGFIGPNGAGKTTTLEMVTGVLQIDEGDILIDGKSIIKEPSMTWDIIKNNARKLTTSSCI